MFLRSNVPQLTNFPIEFGSNLIRYKFKYCINIQFIGRRLQNSYIHTTTAHVILSKYRAGQHLFQIPIMYDIQLGNIRTWENTYVELGNIGPWENTCVELGNIL